MRRSFPGYVRCFQNIHFWRFMEPPLFAAQANRGDYRGPMSLARLVPFSNYLFMTIWKPFAERSVKQAHEHDRNSLTYFRQPKSELCESTLSVAGVMSDGGKHETCAPCSQMATESLANVRLLFYAVRH